MEACTCLIALIALHGGFLAEPVSAICSAHPPVISIKETEPDGTVLFHNTRNPTETITFDIKNTTNDKRGQLKAFFKLLYISNTAWQFQINQTLDLEYIKQAYNINLLSDPLTLTFCGNDDLQINIDPVNEFSPLLPHLQASVQENISLHTEIFGLKKNVTDDDVVRETTFSFSIVPYAIAQFDGREYFGMSIATGGSVTLIKALDYDTLATETFYLNVSVMDAQDSTARTSYSTMMINVIDVDDQEPYFVYPNCLRPCWIPEYTAIVRLDDKGPLKLKPVEITANDSDTLGTPRTFAIISTGNAGNIFTIDSSNGRFTQTQSIRDSGLTDAEFRLVIKVKKITFANLAANAIVVIKVRERISYSTFVYDVPTTDSVTSPVAKYKDLMVPVVVLGVLVAVLIVAIIVVVLIMCWNQKLRMVRPTDDKFEPQTKEEEINTDEDYYNERGDINGKNTFINGISHISTAMHDKIRPLPPLPMRDTCTETTNGKKRKRPRNKKKIKEPEIFDGTKEYNMGIDPEFFDSSDKAKVKRSTRSYPKNSNPALWITISNDKISTNDSLYSP